MLEPEFSDDTDVELIHYQSRNQVKPSSWLCTNKRTVPTGYSAMVTGRTLTWNEWYCVIDWARRYNKSLAQMPLENWNEMQAKIQVRALVRICWSYTYKSLHSVAASDDKND